LANSLYGPLKSLFFILIREARYPTPLDIGIVGKMLKTTFSGYFLYK
jgi:hypothetical protein